MKTKVSEPAGMICQLEFKTTKVKIIHGIFFAVMMLLCAICLLPVIWMFLSAFKDTKEFLKIPPSFLPEKIDFSKVVDTWMQNNIGRTFLNTTFMAAGDILFTIVSNGLAGYVISRLKPRGSKLFFMLIMWTMMLPNNVSQVPLFMTFTDFPVTHWNLSNTYLPMWMLAGANCYYLLLFKSFFDSISISFFESAKIDGASNFKMFTRIVLPLSIPIMAVISIFQFNGAWGNYFWPMLLINNHLQVIGQRILTMKGQMVIDRYVMVMAFVIIPPSVIYIIFQRHIIGGLTLGGVKG